MTNRSIYWLVLCSGLTQIACEVSINSGGVAGEGTGSGTEGGDAGGTGNNTTGEVNDETGFVPQYCNLLENDCPEVGQDTSSDEWQHVNRCWLDIRAQEGLYYPECTIGAGFGAQGDPCQKTEPNATGYTSDDCDAGLLCWSLADPEPEFSQGVCHKPCSSDVDCGVDYRCVDPYPPLASSSPMAKLCLQVCEDQQLGGCDNGPHLGWACYPYSTSAMATTLLCAPPLTENDLGSVGDECTWNHNCAPGLYCDCSGSSCECSDTLP